MSQTDSLGERPESLATERAALVQVKGRLRIQTSGAPRRNGAGEDDRCHRDGDSEENRAGLRRRGFEEHGCEEPPPEERAQDSENGAYDRDPKTASENESEDVAPVGAESHAQSHLALSLADALGDDAVEADSGEKESDGTEDGHHHGAEAILRERAPSDLRHGLEAIDRLARVHRESRLTHHGGERQG